MSASRFVINLPAYSSVYLPFVKDLEAADKTILPEEVLTRLMRQFGATSLPHPIIFNIKNKAFGNSTHCGVLEFSAVKAAYVPNWMMENLMLSDGSEVVLELKELPRLNFVKLQPLKYEFTEIADPRAALEMALSRFTALTLGDVIPISFGGKTYKLAVSELKPAFGSPPAGCTVDTTLNVDFDKPAEEAPERKEPINLEIDTPVKRKIAADEFHYYRAKIPDIAMGVKFELINSEGHPDLYISTESMEPSPLNNVWSYATNRRASAPTGLVIDPREPSFPKSGWFYLSVHSYKEPGEYSLKFVQVEPRKDSELEEKKSTGLSLGRVDSTIGKDDPNFKKCDNCKKYVPLASYSMHSAVCFRNNWCCPTCLQVMPKKDKDAHAHCPKCGLVVDKLDMEKHLDFAHSNVKCECGIEMEQSLLETHKRETCVLRNVPCKYCKVAFPFTTVNDHQSMCGGKSVPCDMCGAMVPRRRMDNHLAAVHRINPCIDSSGYKRPTADSASVSAPVSGIAPLPLAAPMSGTDADLARVLAESRATAGDAASIEDEILAKVMSMSAEEHLGGSGSASTFASASTPAAAPVPSAATSSSAAPGSSSWSSWLNPFATFGSRPAAAPSEPAPAASGGGYAVGTIRDGSPMSEVRPVDLGTDVDEWGYEVEAVEAPASPVPEDVEMSAPAGTTECPICQELFPLEVIETHVLTHEFT